MAFEVKKTDPPESWDHYLAAVTKVLEVFEVTDKTPTEIARAARLAAVDTDPVERENRRVSLRRALRRPKRKGR
jgi:biotin synthase-related radical SAM superfamily protein